LPLEVVTKLMMERGERKVALRIQREIQVSKLKQAQLTARHTTSTSASSSSSSTPANSSASAGKPSTPLTQRQSDLGMFGITRTNRATGITVNAKDVGAESAGELFCRGLGEVGCKQAKTKPFKTTEGLVEHERHCTAAQAFVKIKVNEVIERRRQKIAARISSMRENLGVESEEDGDEGNPVILNRNEVVPPTHSRRGQNIVVATAFYSNCESFKCVTTSTQLGSMVFKGKLLITLTCRQKTCPSGWQIDL